MYIPKRYGESKIENCPFCGRQAIVENEQGMPVCNAHKDKLVPEMRCVCGQYLMMQKGKFGIYFNCLRCGNVSMKKVLEMNDIMKPEPAKTKAELDAEKVHNNSEKKFSRKDWNPGHETVDSDDPGYFD